MNKYINIQPWIKESEVEWYRELIKNWDLDIDSYRNMNDLLSVDLTNYNFRKITLSCDHKTGEFNLVFVE